MGASCTKQCMVYVSDPKRDGTEAKRAEVVAPCKTCDCVRLQSLRDSSTTVIFKEGFALGLKVRKLQTLLSKLDEGSRTRTPSEIPDDAPEVAPTTLTQLVKEPWCTVENHTSLP